MRTTEKVANFYVNGELNLNFHLIVIRGNTMCFVSPGFFEVGVLS